MQDKIQEHMFYILHVVCPRKLWAMTTSFRTNVQPDVLMWARKSVKLSEEEAARKLSVSVSTLVQWEAGESTPTIIQLRKMSNAYKRPLAVLYLRKAPTDFDPIKNFRWLVQEVDFDLDYNLTVSLERISRQQDILLDLLGEDTEVIRSAFPPLNSTDDPEGTGERIASWLGLDIREQQRWARSGSLTREITRLIENKGILVTQVQRVALNQMRGCALVDHPVPAIVVNGADAPTAKAFTLIHELVHILLHTSGIKDVLPLTGQWGDYDAKEKFCNLVAATTLLPREEFRRLVRLARRNSHMPITGEELRVIASGFGVSKQTAMIRMIGLGLENWEAYKTFDWRYAENDVSATETETEEKTSLPLYYPLKVRDLGRLFIEEVRSAYDRHDIGSADLVEYLDTKWENIPKLMKQAGLPS